MFMVIVISWSESREGEVGVGGNARAGDFACVLAGGKRVIICVGSWQACKMPGMRMCRRLS